MKRFHRWLFSGVAAVSLMLCVATLALWIRSHWRDDRIGFECNRWNCWLHSENGHFTVMVGPNYQGTHSFRMGVGFGYWTDPAPSPNADAIMNSTSNRFARLGFAYDANSLVKNRIYNYYTGYRFYFPHWLVVSLTLLVPMSRIRRWLKYRAARHAGLCFRCGYDLRATPDRCPECGKTIEKTI